MTRLDWETLKAKYPIGCKVEGIVNRIWELGVEITLANNVTGIVRNQEMILDGPVDDPTTFEYEGGRLQEGRHIKVAVIHHDARKRQPVLSIRQAIYDPWEQQAGRYQPGVKVSGRVVSL